MTATRTTIVVSRYWDNPQISVFLMQEGIALQVSLEDFVRGLARDAGPNRALFRRETPEAFEARLVAAIAEALEKVKQASAVA